MRVFHYILQIHRRIGLESNVGFYLIRFVVILLAVQWVGAITYMAGHTFSESFQTEGILKKPFSSFVYSSKKKQGNTSCNLTEKIFGQSKYDTFEQLTTCFLRTMKHNKQLHGLMFSDFCSKVMLAGFGQKVECHKMWYLLQQLILHFMIFIIV